jgi:hypothetical protein
MTKLLELKQNLKQLADSIRKSKAAYKQCQREHNGCDGYWDKTTPWKWIGGYTSILSKLKKEFRHKHIAYCLLRGVPRDVIEHPAEDNKPDENLIREIIHAYTDADVCVSKA